MTAHDKLSARENAVEATAKARKLAAILNLFGIKIVPCSKRAKPMETHAGNILERILREQGPEHLTLVLRAIVETGHNLDLTAPVIMAISDIIIAHPTWATTTAFLDALDSADLAGMRAMAKANKRACASREAIATLLFQHLKPILEPPKPKRAPKPPPPKWATRRCDVDFRS